MTDPITVSKLHQEFGSAFFIFDEDAYLRNLEELKQAFQKEYANVKIAYSFKTNYMPRICQLARQSGALAEVVSAMEYELALRVGYSPQEIVFNGPIKTREVLFRAFDEGATVHFDSEYEIDLLEDYCKNRPENQVRCAIRCNFIIADEPLTRFGINAEDDSIVEAYERLFSIESCHAAGIHCHFSTSGRSLTSYAERTKKIIATAKKVFAGRKFEFLDIGGGFFGKMPQELLERFPCKVPTYADYAKVVGGEMKKSFPDQDVQLVLEPGTMVVADTMKFYCQVNHIKHVGEKLFVIVDGSIHNIKPNGKSNIFPSMHVIPMGLAETTIVENADICGYTCIEDDVLASGFSGPIAQGDFIAFDNVGSYSTMYKPPFIKPQPAILSKSGDQYSLIKRAESIDDIFSTYAF
jgi:diaminopimelate decarboxylase